MCVFQHYIQGLAASKNYQRKTLIWQKSRDDSSTIYFLRSSPGFSHRSNRRAYAPSHLPCWIIDHEHVDSVLLGVWPGFVPYLLVVFH